jgi:hypothetical protein
VNETRLASCGPALSWVLAIVAAEASAPAKRCQLCGISESFVWATVTRVPDVADSACVSNDRVGCVDLRMAADEFGACGLALAVVVWPVGPLAPSAIASPVRQSIAYTLLCKSSKYATPSTTSGVVANAPNCETPRTPNSDATLNSWTVLDEIALSTTD